jgi:hypothetical protein
MSDRSERPAWCTITAKLSRAGVTLIELSGNIVGRGCNVPGDLDRKSAREAIASAIAALDYLDRCAQDPGLLQQPLGRVRDARRTAQ